RFVPTANSNGPGFFIYRVWDQTRGKAGGTFDLSTPSSVGGSTAFGTVQTFAVASVSPVSDAPVMDVGGDPPMTPVAPGPTNPAGNLVATLLGASVTDVDAWTSPGIAVTSAATTSGKWQYRLAGTASWVDVGVVSTTSALLLGYEDSIRFVPRAGFSGTV